MTQPRISWFSGGHVRCSSLDPSVGLRATLVALFFASGFVALLYQVIWQRLLGLVTGLDLYAVTLIVAVFMLGMGLGSVAGGALADRLQARSLLRMFAAAEIIVAMFALVSKPLYHDLLYGLAAALAGPPTLLAVAAASTLLVPTFFMGVTLPLLSKALSESVDAASLRIGSLYGWNTLGAAMGAWAGSAVLVRLFGYERSLWIGAVVNLSCAGATLALAGQAGKSTPWPRAAANLAAAGEASRRRSPWSWRTLLSVYFLSGFVALGLEMVWFRLLGVVLKSTAFTFPLLLGFYLLGVGAGSLTGRSLARSSRHPLRWFLLAQAAIPLYAGWSVALLMRLLRTQASFEPARLYLASYEPIDFTFNFFDLTRPELALYVLAPAFVILPPTFLMGASFSFLQRAVQSDLGGLGRRVGALQAANILGATVGVILVGLVLIDWVGTAVTLQLLTACSVVYLVLACADALRAWPGRCAGPG